ncbi:MAG: PIN domain nuclease [Anaerolineae bacterium]|nr:PIN domain nuclease [Anaerolineae bacterium]
MTAEFIFRLLGMIVFAALGASFGVNSADFFSLPEDANGLIFSLLGALIGLIITPWITTRPGRSLERFLLQSPTEVLVASLAGLCLGLLVAALAAWSIAQLPGWFGEYLPTAFAATSAYTGMAIFAVRAYDLLDFARGKAGIAYRGAAGYTNSPNAAVLLDTSIIIDGRILEISKAGFITGAILIPQFVLSELQHIANSSDPLRRQRGRHGLEILNKLKQEGANPVQIITDDPEQIEAVDAKLVEIAKQRNIPLMTNDFNLDGIATVQNVQVLNLNALSLAMQPEYLPGETIEVRIIQEGREADQGVSYLKDGTMVVVEGGRRFLDRMIPITITRFIRSTSGKMYFGVPHPDPRQ